MMTKSKKAVNSKMGISDFHIADPIPQDAIKNVSRILKSANLFRYIGDSPADSEVALLEKEFAEYLGKRYALALNSCSSAIFISLLCAGVKPGDKVLIPAFTFTAVPSSVLHAGANPVLVECDNYYHVDLKDLRNKISPDVKFFLLSHMRGHTSDLDEIVKICNEKNITLIEDAAHSLGVLWDGKPVGTYGKVGCYSFQSYKIINAGEGGILVTDDEELIVKAIYYSGAYEKLWKKHFVDSDLFSKYQNLLPAFNLRMNNVSAAIVRPQIKLIDRKVKTYIENYSYLVKILKSSEYIDVPGRDNRERMAPDSIQFNLKNFTSKQTKAFMDEGRARGISIYVFGADKNNARVYWNWKFLGNIPELPITRTMLMSACDMRLPVFLTRKDLHFLGTTILDIINNIKK